MVRSCIAFASGITTEAKHDTPEKSTMKTNHRPKSSADKVQIDAIKSQIRRKHRQYAAAGKMKAMRMQTAKI